MNENPADDAIVKKKSTPKPSSDAFVFFGATCDLAYKQIFPALQAMIRRGHFDMPIIGMARSAKDLDGPRARAHESIEKHGGVDSRAFAALSEKLQYVNGDYDSQETFRQLRKALGARPHPVKINPGMGPSMTPIRRSLLSLTLFYRKLKTSRLIL
jgi:glucose-6-phosphate 1-dehydrogenase